MHKTNALLAGSDFIVTYTPLPNEANPNVTLQTPENAFLIPQDRTTDPVVTATEAMRAAAERATCILIPGTRFDAHGTRHGRGGGWYDRFLSTIPAEWLRIGVCTESQWSDAPLHRESWDEPVDHVAVVRTDGIGWFETMARPNVSTEYP